MTCKHEKFEAHDDVNVIEGEPTHLRNIDTGWELNAGGLLWEEFLLALPEKILCADTCLGLCPQCGKNRNMEQCACNNPDSQSPLARALPSSRPIIHVNSSAVSVTASTSIHGASAALSLS